MKQSKKLELCLLNYFLLIAIAAVMIGIEFYFEMSRPDLLQDICADPATTKELMNASTVELPHALSDLRTKIVVMFGVLTIVVSIVMMMFVKNITRPLQRTLDTAKLINDGDLSQVIHIEAHDEVGQLGIVINELTSNFQEIATSTSAMIKTIESRLDTLSESLSEDNPDHDRQITQIRQELDALHAFVDSFNLLQTELSE